SGGVLDPSTVQSSRDKMINPAVLIVVSQVKNSNPDVAREDYAAIACAIQNIMLSLHAEGVGSKWSTGAVIRDERTYTHLGIDHASEEIVAFLWVGVPAKSPIKVVRKRTLGELVRYLP
ncbi:MAG TPA: nitroreductase family protein, partial [Polyangiaceae bacterium]|nr:nitroreductase family protein [Polyangiaceae bacterium]